jgi:hypothetical protein
MPIRGKNGLLTFGHKISVKIEGCLNANGT